MKMIKKVVAVLFTIASVVFIENTQIKGAINVEVQSVELTGGSDFDAFYGVALTGDGGYVAVGESYSSASGDITDVNNGTTDSLIAKYDGDGNLEYTKLMGNSGEERLHSVAATSDGGYVVAGESYSFANTAFEGLLAKYDGGGNLEYTRLTSGISNVIFNSVAITSDGGYVAVGYSGSDAFLVKFDSEGNLEYTKSIDSAVGYNNSNFYGVATTNDGGYVAAGYKNTTGGATSDAFVAKYDNQGNLEYTRLVAVSGSSNVFFEVAATSDGGYAAIGHSDSSESGDILDTNNGATDGLIAKYDSQGNLEYTSLTGGSGNDSLYGLEVRSDGGYVAVGYSDSSQSGDILDTNNGSIDGLIVSYDSEGNLEYTDLIGGSGSDYILGVKRINDNRYAMIGFSSSSESGEILDTNNGDADGLNLRYQVVIPPTIDASDFSVDINSSLTDDQIIAMSNATAIDASDNDLTNIIEVSDRSALDLTTPGKYTVVLSVQDSYGQESLVEVVITVVDEDAGLPDGGIKNISLGILLLLGTIVTMKKVIKFN